MTGRKGQHGAAAWSLGVDVIEAGFPIASEGDYTAVRAVARECRQVIVAALCRTSEQDVLKAAAALEGAAHPRIHTFVATSDLHLEYKLRKTRAEVLEMTRHADRWPAITLRKSNFRETNAQRR